MRRPRRSGRAAEDAAGHLRPGAGQVGADGFERGRPVIRRWRNGERGRGTSRHVEPLGQAEGVASARTFLCDGAYALCSD